MAVSTKCDGFPSGVGVQSGVFVFIVVYTALNQAKGSPDGRWMSVLGEPQAVPLLGTFQSLLGIREFMYQGRCEVVCDRGGGGREGGREENLVTIHEIQSVVFEIQRLRNDFNRTILQLIQLSQCKVNITKGQWVV